MGEPKFTPGPWHQGTCDSWIVWAPRYGSTDWVPEGAEIGTSEAVCVASIVSPAWAMAGLDDAVRDAWLAESTANARLIAAAPDLLASVTSLVDAMQRYQVDVEGDAPQEHIDMMDQARAALAKARGEP